MFSYCVVKQVPVAARITHAFYFYAWLVSGEITCHLLETWLARYRRQRREGTKDLLVSCIAPTSSGIRLKANNEGRKSDSKLASELYDAIGDGIANHFNGYCIS